MLNEEAQPCAYQYKSHIIAKTSQTSHREAQCLHDMNNLNAISDETKIVETVEIFTHFSLYTAKR